MRSPSTIASSTSSTTAAARSTSPATGPAASCWCANGSSCSSTPRHRCSSCRRSRHGAPTSRSAPACSRASASSRASSASSAATTPRCAAAPARRRPCARACAPLEIARENRLPYVHLVESAAPTCPTRARSSSPAVQTFRDITAPVGCRHPHDRHRLRQLDRRRRLRPRHERLHVVMIDQRSKVFLGGPPLVKMATGEDERRRDPRRRRHARPHLRPRRLPRQRRGRRPAHRPRDRAPPQLAQARPGAARRRPTRRATTPRSCSASRRATCACRSTPREVIARVVDGSALRRVQAALRRDAGDRLGRASTATRSASSPTTACCSPRSRRRRRSSSSSPTRSTCRSLFLQNITGYMVGKRLRAAAASSRTARKMINAVTNSHGAAPHA